MGRVVIRVLARLVDGEGRREWVREWDAEIAEARLRGSGRTRVLLWAGEDALRCAAGRWAGAAQWQEIRSAVRGLRRAPGYSLAVIGTLALGIGANSAVFSVVDTYLIRSYALHEPERLVVLNKQKDLRFGLTSAPNYLDWRERSRSFEGLAAAWNGSTTITGLDSPLRETSGVVSPGFFEIVGVTPSLGRAFLDREGVPGEHHVAILSHDLWSDAFAADPGILGSSITLDGEPTTVVGVLPAQVAIPGFAARVYTPMAFVGDALEVRGRNNLRVVGRLADGVSVARASAEMDGIGRQLAIEYPEANDGWTVAVRPLRYALVGGRARPLWVLLGSAGFVLLIACVNVASLIVARGMTRERELSIRVSLGAPGSRLTAQILAETVVLAVLGGVLGAALAYGAIEPIRALIPGSLRSLGEVAVDLRVLTFALVTSLVTGVLAGLVPAVRIGRRAAGSGAGLGGLLRERSGTSSGQVGLVGVQFALATVLLVGSGLMMRSLAALNAEDVGVQVDGRSTFRVTFPVASYPEPLSVADAVDGVIGRLQGEADGVAAVSHLPLSGANLRSSILIEGRDTEMTTNSPSAGIRVVTPEYFRTAGIPTVSGRSFTSDDGEDAEPVAVINRRAAEMFWPSEDPIGRWIAYAEDDEGAYIRRRIVGVVGDVRFAGPSQPAVPEVYQPHRQTTEVWRWFGRSMSFLVRTRDDEALPLAVARAAVAGVDPDLPVIGLTTLSDISERSIGTPRFQGVLITSFAGLALMLAVVGLYGVTAFSVRRRWREIGVRMALGADRSEVVLRVVTGALATAAVGVTAGLAGALLLGGFLRGMLFGVSERDPWTLGATLVALLAVAVLAALRPALGAARVDPVESLAAE